MRPVTYAEPQLIFRQVLAHAEASPDKPAVLADGHAVTYAELAAGAGASARALSRGFNLEAGERIVLMAGSNADFIRTYLAAHCLGAITVPLAPDIAAEHFGDIVERTSPRLIVSDTAVTDRDIPCIGFRDLTEAAEQATAPNHGVSDAQAADILFTTGTTGRPKGVVLSQRAIAAAAEHINRFIGIRAEDVEVLPLPLSHSFGLGRVRCVLSAGATLVLVPGFVNAAKIVSALSEFRATGFASVPTGIALLLSEAESALERFSGQLEYIEIGSSPMPAAHKERLMRLFPRTRICMHYGLTEASRSAYISFHDDSARLGSIGRPSPGVEMRIVDDSGLELADGSSGHIEIRGRHVMSEYWQAPTLTAETMKAGWLRTGDRGRRDADGYFYLEARDSDTINVGGRKVHPQEIEDILARHPAVAECACVGMPDPQGLSGEIISVFLVADPEHGSRPKLSELASLLRAALEPYKIPRKFTWVEQLPRSSSGKLLRRHLREAAEE